MDKNIRKNEEPAEQQAADREKHNPFKYDTGLSEENPDAGEEAESEQERKEALTERD